MKLTSITSISMPLALQKEMRREAKAERLTLSGLIQEAMRFYLESRKWKKLQQDIAYRARKSGITSEDDVEALIDEVRR